MTPRKKLIEVALALEAINKAIAQCHPSPLAGEGSGERGK
jgi:hypothetical protein